MAARPKLDGAGVQKMKTIDEANTQVQRLHGIVENFALTIKRKQPTQLFGSQIKRALTPLIGLLKPQFGMIADQVTAMILVSGRGGGEQLKVRAMREYVGQIRQALDIMVSKVKDQHAVAIEVSPD